MARPAIPAAPALPTLYVAGAKNIAAVIGRSPKATFHLLETDQLPARKIGGIWTLDLRAFAEQFRSEAVAA
jgi:hypothetical protein